MITCVILYWCNEVIVIRVCIGKIASYKEPVISSSMVVNRVCLLLRRS